MKRFFLLRPLTLLLATLAVLATATPARAAERPHASSGTAQFTATGFVGTGRALHLGTYTEEGTIQLFPTSDPTVFDASATAIYTAANGDELHATFTGQLNFATGVITATVTYVGGTGRFAGATGSATLSGQLLQDGTLAVSVIGTIDY